MFRRTVAATILVAAAVAPAAQAGWREPVPTPLDASATANARTPAMAVVDGSPHVAWEEDRAIRVARLGATGWQPAGDALSSDGSTALAPALAADGAGALIAAWEERGRGIAAARMTSAGRQPLPLLGDQYSYSPSLAVLGGEVYAAYTQGERTGFDVRVARLTEAGWERVGGVLDVSAREEAVLPLLGPAPQDATEPVLAAAGDRLLAAWIEGGSVHVARLDGTAWPLVGGAVTTSGAPVQLDLAVAGTTPYVAWRSAEGAFKTHVARYDGTAWTQPAPALPGEEPDLETIDGTPWLAWEDRGQVRVARLGTAGTAWEQPAAQVDGPGADAPALAGVAGIPFVAYGKGPTTATLDLRVSRLEPVFGSLEVTAQSTSATLVTRLITYGLPYGVAFTVGGARTATQTASGDPATVADSVSGLSARTTYEARALATAGAGPEVAGPVASFTTPKKNGR